MCDLHKPHFQDPEKAREYLESQVWPNGPVCPHCGGIERNSKTKGGRAGLYFCGDCRSQFTVTVGSLFERSKIPLHKWLLAVHLLCSSKKGMSSHQLHRTLGVTYKTAWFMTHRIREAMKDKVEFPQLGGKGKIVEADEAYFGTETGKDKKQRGRRGGAAHNAMNKIVSLVEREGQLRSFHVSDVTGPNLKQKLVEQIHKDTHVITDSSPRYNIVKRERPFFRYDQVNHSKGEYVNGIAHTNTVEGFFSIMKRGLIGTYHHVSSEHLQRYLAEFDFRYNHRERKVKVNGKTVKAGYTDAERFAVALKGIKGKRLTYRRTDAAA